MAQKPDMFACDFPGCPQDELTEADVTQFHIRVSTPANPGNEIIEPDLCEDHAAKLNSILNDYR